LITGLILMPAGPAAAIPQTPGQEAPAPPADIPEEALPPADEAGLERTAPLVSGPVTREMELDIPYWEELVAASPDDVTLRLALGNSYAMNHRVPEAIRQYRKALKGYPHYREAWNNLGSVYRAEGRWSDALGAYRKAIRVDPQYALAYYNIGVVYDAQGFYDRAVKNYGVAIRYEPRLLSSKFNPQVVANRHLLAAFLEFYTKNAGVLALPLEPAFPRAPAPGGAEDPD
jgi:tetratricopeptide (TPR) repeat protein